jgi:AbrB family looped-hinge helix DNA binding protein
MSVAILKNKGQVTIPADICKALGIQTGDRISFHLREDGIVEIQAERVDLLSLCGILKPRIHGVTLEDFEEAIAKGATEQ